MTVAIPNPPRPLACPRCGTAFECMPANCWCAAEPYRLPVPYTADEDCLCPSCLRAAAGTQIRRD